MKMEYVNRRADRVRRGPAFSTIDLAQRYGVSVQRLCGLLSRHPEGRPSPALKFNQGYFRNAGNYYNLQEADKWARSIGIFK